MVLALKLVKVPVLELEVVALLAPLALVVRLILKLVATVLLASMYNQTAAIPCNLSVPLLWHNWQHHSRQDHSLRRRQGLQDISLGRREGNPRYQEEFQMVNC